MSGQHRGGEREPRPLDPAVEAWLDKKSVMADGTFQDWRPFAAVAMKETGKDTQPFAAIRDPEPCKCEMAGCPDGPRDQAPAGKHAMLSYAPGVTTRMSLERVRNGTYDDIPKSVREGSVRVQRYAVDWRARIQMNTEHGVLDLRAMFDRNQALRTDPAADEGLKRLEAEQANRLAAVNAGGWRALPAVNAEYGVTS